MNLDPRFKKTTFAIEANSYETLELWKMWQFDQQCNGWNITVGLHGKRPICVSFTWATLNNKLIVFYEPTSQLVDYEMIENWLDKNCPVKRSDANNFHQCLSSVYNEQIDKRRQDLFDGYVRIIKEHAQLLKTLLPRIGS